MADPSSDDPDQPAGGETKKSEDAAARLNEILSSPVENPFAADAKSPVPAPAIDSPARDPARDEVAKLPADFAAWQGATPDRAETEGQPENAQPSQPAVASEPKAPHLEQQPSAPPRPPPPAAREADAASVIGKVRRLMLVSTVLTAAAIAAVLGIIGYRLFTAGGRQDAPTQATLTLPPGAKIVQTAIGADRLVLTLDLGGALEVRTYDLRTLKPLGRLNFTTVP
jgi:hypothetical protein